MTYEKAKKIVNNSFWYKHEGQFSIGLHEDEKGDSYVRFSGKEVQLSSDDLKKLAEISKGHTVTIGRTAANFRMIIS